MPQGGIFSSHEKRKRVKRQGVIRLRSHGGSWLSVFSVFCWITNNNESKTIFCNITHSFEMKCSFLDWFESSRRPKGCAVRVWNPLIFSWCVEFPCHLVRALVGWIQTTGFAYAALTVVIIDNRGIIFSKTLPSAVHVTYTDYYSNWHQIQLLKLLQTVNVLLMYVKCRLERETNISLVI